MKVLFVTRKFPPHVGGMERAAGELHEHLSQISEVKLIKWGGSNRLLLLILPYFLLYAIWIRLTSHVDCVYLQDGLLAPIGLVLKLLRKPVVITVHGLDITYRNRAYQIVIPRCLKRLDRVVCISDATAQECVSRGVPREKTVMISWGVSDRFRVDGGKAALRERIATEFGVRLAGEKLLFSVGRVVERKGFHWFVQEVMPMLLKEKACVKYVIAGDGEFRKELERVISRSGLGEYVILLGKVEDDALRLAYSAADIFVMPNIHVPGDMEGFGLVALEASSSGLPVVASDMEGINKAVTDGENGFLVERGDARGFVDIILGLLRDEVRCGEVGRRGREFTLRNHGWETCAKRYLEEFQTVTGQ